MRAPADASMRAGKIVSRAGSTVYPESRHSSSPPPAMIPSSAAPRKSVKTETKNAAAAPKHAVVIGGPTYRKTAIHVTDGRAWRAFSWR